MGELWGSGWGRDRMRDDNAPTFYVKTLNFNVDVNSDVNL